MKKILLSLIVFIAILGFMPELSATSFSYDTTLKSSFGNAKMEDEKVNQNITLPSSFEKMSENSNLELYFSEELANIAVYDKTADYYWFSSPLELQGDNNDLWVSKISSPIEIVYAEENLNQVDSALLQEGNSYTVDKIDNGFVLHTVFQDEIKFDVEFTLTDSKLDVTIPFDKITDGSTISLCSVKIMPYFGAVYQDDIEGYFTISSWVGSIMRFRESNQQVNSPFEGTVYSSDYSYDGSFFTELLLPLFGVTHGNNDQSFASYITSGEYNSNLYVKPAGFINGYNQANWVFNYRKIYFQDLSSERTLRQLGPVAQFDGKITYDFLANEASNYVGIAKSYRSYLLENGYLTKGQEYVYKTRLEYSVSGEAKSLFSTKRVLVSETSDIMQQVTSLLEAGVDTTLSYANYLDVPTSPYYYLNTKGKLIDFDDLSKDEYSEFLASNGITDDYGVVLNYAASDSKGFKASRDGVKTLAGNYSTIDNEYYLLDQSKTAEILRPELIEKTLESNRIAINWAQIGTNSNNPESKDNLYEGVDELLAKLEGYEYGQMLMDPKFVHDAAYLKDTPFYGIGYAAFDETVPLLPLVYSGVVPLYSTDLSYEILNEDLMLRLVEYNIYPSFALIAKDYTTVDVDKNNYKPFATMQDSIIEFNQFATDAFAAIGNAEMTNHEMVDTNIAKVTYSNGTEIVFNYGNAGYSYQGNSVAAKSYTVIKGGQNG